MKEKFVKTIQGHELAFVKVQDPVQYSIMINSPEYEDITVVARQDKEGLWSLQKKNDEPLEPYWLNEISLDIHEAIVENEEEPIPS